MENDNKELKEETTKKEADKKETESKEETKQPVEETAVTEEKEQKMDWYCSSCSCSNSIGIWWCGNLLPVSFPESYLYQ